MQILKHLILKQGHKDNLREQIWYRKRLGGGTQADSIMDKIIHNSYTIPTTDNNLRKLYDSKKAKVVIDSLG